MTSSARVSLIPMQCLRCQQPVPAQPDEVVWVCQNCGQGLALSDEAGLVPQAIHYAAGVPVNASGKPVWVASGQATLQRETFGGSETREMQAFWAQPRWFFVPAYTLKLEQLAEAGVRLLRQPLPLQEVPARVSFLPVTVHPEDVRPLAEYILLSIEAERRDQLRLLNFNLQLSAPELWIFP